MIFQIGNFAKTSVANVTSVWPTSIVNIHMRFEVTRSRKRFLAKFAFVGFFL